MTPEIKEASVIPVLDKKYIRVFDLQYAEGKHYFNATRRTKDNLVALKNEKDFCEMLPDAVTCIVILKSENGTSRLLLAREYRYPAGRYLLSPPAGLLDSCDKDTPNPVISAAIREIHEETGLIVDDSSEITIINPLLFSSPGMTDESNALVKVVMPLNNPEQLSQDLAEESECFDGFRLVSKDEARRLLAEGRDENGFFYSVYTWAALMHFVSCQD